MASALFLYPGSSWLSGIKNYKNWIRYRHGQPNTCWKSRQNPRDGAKKPQGRLSPPTICLAAKNWTNQNRTEALFVEGAGDGFKTALALLVENGDPSMYWMNVNFQFFHTVQGLQNCRNFGILLLSRLFRKNSVKSTFY